MDITDRYNITIVLSNTNLISVTTTLSGTTYTNTGTVFVNPFFAFDPLNMLAWFMIFVAVGVGIRKPTSFIIAWIGMAIIGVFNIDPIYGQWTLFLLVTGFVLYHLYRRIQKV